MKIFSIKKITPAFIFSFFVFALLPLKLFPFYSDGLLDPELGLRFLCTSLIVFSFFLYFLLRRNKISLPAINQTLTFVFAAYIFFSGISLIVATIKGGSFYELIRLIIFLFFYLCFVILLQKKEEALPVIIKNINISILVFSAIGLYQLYPLLVNFIEKGKAIELKLSLASSLGNKNFYSETLLMALPFIVYGITIFKKAWRGISIFNFIFILITIVYLQTVSVWLGLSISIFLMGIFYRKRLFESRKTKAGFVITFVCVVIVTGIIVYSKPAFFNSFTSKFNIALKYIHDPEAMENYSLENNNSTYERIILWRNSFKMIKEHPLLGVGLGEWKIYFPKYGMGRAPYMNSGFIRFEKPHNDFLLACCETGIPGLISYLTLFFISFRCCKKIISAKQTEKDKLLMRLMAAGLTGFLTISFFGYPNQRPFTMIFLMLVLAVVQSEYLKLVPAKGNANAKNFYNILFICGILISAYALNIGTKRMKAEMHLSNALRAQKYKNWGIMIRETTLAESSFFPMDYTGTPIYWYRGFANFYAGNQNEAFVNFQKAEKVNPYHINVLNDLGTNYDLQGQSETAKLYYLKTINISPLYANALLNLSVIYYNTGNIDSAYMLISHPFLANSQNYSKDLDAILHAKALKIVQQVSDSAARASLSEKINDEKWLLSIHKESQKENTKLENLLLSIPK
ncbi:MAG: O-antigen ligase family protein [Bacteroidota bacterium]